MADTITVKFKVMEDGSLKAIGKDADKASAALSKAGSSADHYSKKQKGVAGISSNSTKNFSKMTTGITDGLVPAYATLAANVFALTAAFNVLSRNDAIAKLQEGLEFTGRAAGRNLGLVADRLKDITDNAISAEQAMRTTAVGISAGFTQQQMEGLAKVAKGAALALGRDMGDAMDRLTRGAAKLEPEILDELGIMVRLDDAVRDYALAHNKATSELTQFERRMAFTNAIIDDGIAKYSALSEALDPSAYAQLSASFADLTKTFVQGINTFFGPMLSFFAKTPIAVGALAAAFGASLTGQIMGGLEGMAKSSEEASRATKDLVGESLKGVKAHEKLGKAFNEVANGVSREKADLDRMMKSLNMTVNMTSKDIVKLKIAKKARNQLTKEIHLQDIAQAKSTHSTALSTMQTHGLSAAAKVQAQAFRELAIAHTTATQTTTGFATAGVYARTVTTGLAMSVRFLGAAFLTAMPYIAGILTAFSLLSPLFRKLFGDSSDLGKAMKVNAERFEEFENVASQYVKTIPHARKETEIWVHTLKPVAGLLTEVAAGLDSAYSAAQADRIRRLATATKNLADSQTYLAKATSPMQIMAGKLAAGRAEKGIEEAGILKPEEIDKLKDAAVEGVTSAVTALSRMEAKLQEMDAKGADRALSIVQGAISELNKDLESFLALPNEEAFKNLATYIKESSDRANAAVDAFTTFGETVKKAKELIGDPKATFGKYSKEIDNVTESINKLNATGDEAPTEKMVEDMLAAYGKVGGTVEDLEALKKVLIDINDRTKQNAIDAAELATAQALGVDKVANANEAIRIAEEASAINRKEFNKVAIEDTQKYNDLQIEGQKLLQEEIKLIKEKYDLLASMSEEAGMGAAAAAAIRGQGAITAAKDQGAQEALRTEVARQTLAGVAEDIKAIGPEGALMSSAIQGALNMEQAFTTAFEVMGDKSNDMSTRVQAGLGAVGAAVSAIGAMQKAASDQKIAAIDNEIAAEKARDGKSAGSVAKLAALEKKKEQAKRKAFEQDKKMKMAQTVISTAQGVTAMLGAAPPPVNFALAAMVAAMGAQQLSMIQGMTYSGGAASAPTAPSQIAVGSRNASVDLARGENAAGELAYARGESGIGSGMTNFRPAFSGYKNRAAGGFVVGEQGPELFMPEVPGEIVPAGRTPAGQTNVNFSISAVDATGVEELLLNQRGNIIGMIREAANEHGEFFLEGVQETSY